MSNQAEQFSAIIQKCWEDEAFKQSLRENPVETLRKEGVSVPEGVTVRVFENTADTFNLVIPQPPHEISDEDLAHVAGGKYYTIESRAV